MGIGYWPFIDVVMVLRIAKLSQASSVMRLPIL